MDAYILLGAVVVLVLLAALALVRRERAQRQAARIAPDLVLGRKDIVQVWLDESGTGGETVEIVELKWDELSEEAKASFAKSMEAHERAHALLHAALVEAPQASKRRRSWATPAGPRTTQKAAHALDALSTLVPKRVSNEEIGDALEAIDRLVKAGRPKWFIYMKVATTYFWVLVHTVLHYSERVAGIWAKAAGKGDAKSKE